VELHVPPNSPLLNHDNIYAIKKREKHLTLSFVDMFSKEKNSTFFSNDEEDYK
jgi:hypothetical protein